MKTRMGFVSNSSSSSFIVLATKKVTKEDIVAILAAEKGAIDSVLEYAEDVEATTVVDEAADYLWSALNSGATLGSIRGGGGTVSSEGDLGDQMLYSLGEIKTKDFVFSSTGG